MLGENFRNRLGVIANIAVIAVSAIALFFIVRDRVINRQKFSGLSDQLSIGKNLSLSDVSWSERQHSVVLAFVAGCKYCADSAAFYQKLNACSQQNGKLQLIGISPHSNAVASSYLTANHIPINAVRKTDFGQLRIQRVPLLMLVGKEGKISKVWAGKLSSQVESEVLKAVSCEDRN